MQESRQTQMDKFEKLFKTIANKHNMTTTGVRKMLAEKHARSYYEGCKECVRLNDEEGSQTDPDLLADMRKCVANYEKDS